MFWCSIRVPYFQASKLNPGNHVQLHATLGLKMYIQLLMECCRTPSWSHCPPSPVVDFNIKRFPSFEGPEATRLVFTGIQIVVNFWLFHISIGIGDTIANPKVMSYIIQHIGEKKQQVAEIIDDAYYDCLKPMPGMTIRKSFESKAE
ncbi:hypothetical protein L210DRAFT_3503102 [Boletus edulis BED1]|uniref:DNA-directed RNA polymerase n=1 Tax=Boletus edulis BED1 TaxID=1328754 RepID=A0AAD4BWM4_BOLED|nr:hypothetical protein L210DRAFT_3503102 [Boletus edulis BED1]